MIQLGLGALIGVLLAIYWFWPVQQLAKRHSAAVKQGDAILAERKRLEDELKRRRQNLATTMERAELPYVCHDCQRVNTGAVEEHVEEYPAIDGIYRRTDKSYWLVCKCGENIKQLNQPT